MVHTNNLTPTFDSLDALDDLIHRMELELDAEGLSRLHDRIEKRRIDVEEAMVYVANRRADQDRRIL